MIDDYITKQKDNVHKQYKLYPMDMTRLSKKITGSPFDLSGCVLWNAKKVKAKHFRINGEQREANRILYSNYVEPLQDNEYVRMSCGNDMCVTLSHMKKHVINKKVVNFDRLTKPMVNICWNKLSILI
jgi:hypothetical protein